MTGFNQLDGTLLSGEPHLIQSITDILTTPIGSRVMRRDYGSRLYTLMDAPINRQTAIEFTMAIADALRRWEPRLRVTRVQVDHVRQGELSLTIEATIRRTEQIVRLEKLLLTPSLARPL